MKPALYLNAGVQEASEYLLARSEVALSHASSETLDDIADLCTRLRECMFAVAEVCNAAEEADENEPEDPTTAVWRDSLAMAIRIAALLSASVLTTYFGLPPEHREAMLRAAYLTNATFLLETLANVEPGFEVAFSRFRELTEEEEEG